MSQSCSFLASKVTSSSSYRGIFADQPIGFVVDKRDGLVESFAEVLPATGAIWTPFNRCESTAVNCGLQTRINCQFRRHRR
jgi:hypothetical protein